MTIKKYNSKPKKTSLLFKLIVLIVRLFYPKTKFNDVQNIPNEPSIIVSNHAKTNGPIITQLSFPVDRYMWCIGEMMSSKEIPKYAYKDFWSKKPKCVRWLYKILSYIIAPCSFIFKNAYSIGVYKDARILDTFKQTVLRLNEGNHVIVFPECDKKYNEIVNDFQQNFVDVAKLYHKRYNVILSFTPMYIAPTIKTVTFGKPIKYNPEISLDIQRGQICEYLKNEITRIAKQLPTHKVVPYENVPKRKYKNSK